MTAICPERVPLNTPTISHILRQCGSSTARRRVIKREIDLAIAGFKWGTLTRKQTLAHLYRIEWAFKAWNKRP